MTSTSQSLFHISNQKFAIDYIDQRDIIKWNGAEFNQNTVNLNAYSPRLNVAGSGIDVGLIQGVHSLNREHLDEGDEERFLPYLANALELTNRRYIEHIFETVRQAEFSHLPSRNSCMFLTDLSNLPYWYHLLKDDEHTVIYKFQCNGKMHASDANWIDSGIVDLNKYYENARFYWEGTTNTNFAKDATEVLFVGELQKIARYNSLDELTNTQGDLNEIFEKLSKLILKESYFSLKSDIHGIWHTYRVMLNAIKLSISLQRLEDTLTVAGAAFLHDLSRTHEGICHVHGQMAAIEKLPIFYSLFLHLGLSRHNVEEIKYAAINHCKDDATIENQPKNTVLSILKDADALDRIRFGTEALDVKYLRHPESIDQVDYARNLFHRSENSPIERANTFFISELESLAQQLKGP